MDPRKLTETMAVSPQIDPADVPTIADAGFAMIINNRPDGESSGQPQSAAIQAAAKREGLDYRWIPFSGAGMTDDDVAAFQAALAEAKGPVLAFCRSGTRSTFIWSLAVANAMPFDEIADKAMGAGYDIRPLERAIRSRQPPDE